MHVEKLPALPSDNLLERVVEIEEKSFTEPWTTADFEWLSRDERALFLGLRCHDRLVGYAIAYVEGPDLHLVSLAVEEKYRRQGWGGHLLASALAKGAQRGCHTCRLEVRESNRAAIELYAKRGFEMIGRQRRFYRGPPEDALVMQRRIGAGGEPGLSGLDSNPGTD